MPTFFSGQGKVFIADVLNGVPGAFRFLGDAPAFDLGFETQVLETKESTTGQRQTVSRLLQEKTATLALTLHEHTRQNMALAFFGDDAVLPGASVTNEIFTAGVTIADGDFARLANAFVSSVVIKDSNGTPATLAEGVDYRVESANHGTIEFLANVGTYTQPFTADYDYASQQNVRMLTQALTEKWIRLDGLNTANADNPVLVELYRVSFDPAELLNMISDELSTLVLNGSALYDSTKETDPVLGTFGRFVAAEVP